MDSGLDSLSDTFFFLLPAPFCVTFQAHETVQRGSSRSLQHHSHPTQDDAWPQSQLAEVPPGYKPIRPVLQGWPGRPTAAQGHAEDDYSQRRWDARLRGSEVLPLNKYYSSRFLSTQQQQQIIVLQNKNQQQLCGLQPAMSRLTDGCANWLNHRGNFFHFRTKVKKKNGQKYDKKELKLENWVENWFRSDKGNNSELIILCNTKNAGK